MNWPLVNLGSVIELKAGFAFKSAEYIDTGIKLLRGDNIAQGYLRWGGVRSWPEDNVIQLQDYMLEVNDVVLAMDRPWIQAGLKWSWLRDADLPTLLVQRVARLRSKKQLDQIFLRYIIGGQAFTDHVLSITTGVNVPYISGADIEVFEFPLPSLPIQKRIAGILSAYDDLIAVNERRIAILEEMARRVFWAWFQNANNGSIYGDLLQSSLGGDWGKEQPEGEFTKAIKVVRGTDFPALLSGSKLSCPTRYIKHSSFKKRALQPYDLVIENSINAKTRAAGKPLLITHNALAVLETDAIAASFCKVFRFKKIEDSITAFHHLRLLREFGEIEEFQTVAANGIANFQSTGFQQRCNFPKYDAGDDLDHEAKISLLAKLDTTAIARQNSNLRTTRDLLLPRLISGEIDVSDAKTSETVAAE